MVTEAWGSWPHCNHGRETEMRSDVQQSSPISSFYLNWGRHPCDDMTPIQFNLSWVLPGGCLLVDSGIQSSSQ